MAFPHRAQLIEREVADEEREEIEGILHRLMISAAAAYNWSLVMNEQKSIRTR